MIESQLLNSQVDELLQERRELLNLADAASQHIDELHQLIERQAAMISRLRGFEEQSKAFLMDTWDRSTGDVVCFQRVDIERIEYLLSFTLSAK